MQKKIGILTWHNHGNIGGALQAYALFAFLQNINCNVIIINYDKLSNKISNSGIFKLIKKIIGRVFVLIDRNYQTPYSFCFRRFEWKYLNETSILTNKHEIEKTVSNMSHIVCGSDQIWAPNVFDSVYMLDFNTDERTKKIAYAPSIGLNRLSFDIAEQYKVLLSDFFAISIRETQGQEILKKQCGINSTVVLDPTLLLEKKCYESLEKKIMGIREPYVLCYFLNEKHEYKKSVLEALKQKNYSIVGISKNVEDSDWMQLFKYVGPSEFLWLIHNATYVFTDSYHGTIFSLLYHKEFYTFKRFQEQDEINQNSRLNQLITWFNIEDRIIDSGMVPQMENKYDFSDFENKLISARNVSINYLLEALR